MTRLTTLLAAALAISACAPSSEDDAARPYREAIPTTQAVKIGTPDAEASAGALTVERAVLGDSPATQSEYAVLSYHLAVSVNGGVEWILDLVRLVTNYPATSCDESACTWGPWIDDAGLNRWKLDVVRRGDAYEWAFSAQPGSNPAAPFVDLITGTARPVDRERGSGVLDVDFDAQDGLDHGPLWVKKDHGRLHVGYDNASSPATVTATFEGARNSDPANPHPMNAAYAFEKAASGGELQIAFENLTTTEQVSLRTRWSPSGAGRGDAHYFGPAGSGVEFTASECWDGEVHGFAEVYDSKSPGAGSEAACSPFASALYADVALP